MKKYLFGLGAMLVGAGLMFVLMHGEVSADSKPELFVCSGRFEVPLGRDLISRPIYHCKTKNLDCALDFESGNISCVKG